MTELLQTPLESEPTPTPKPQPVVYFDAHITFATPMKVVPGGIELQLDGQPVIVELHPSIVLKVQETPPEPERVYMAVLWFRMNGTEVQTLSFARYAPAKGKKIEQTEPTFRISARVMDASSQHHLVLLQVEPNAKGTLSEPFLVHVWSRAKLIKRLPERHRTVVAVGKYHHSSRRLVASGFNPFRVGPLEGKEASAIENSSVRLDVTNLEQTLPPELQTPLERATPIPVQVKAVEPPAAKPPKPPADTPAQATSPVREDVKRTRVRAPKP
jgi:hypothetical protein